MDSMVRKAASSSALACPTFSNRHFNSPLENEIKTETQMKRFITQLLAVASVALVTLTAPAADTVKVGVLHSLSGTMAISETSLKDVLLFTFDEINKSGGVKSAGRST